MPNWCYNRLTVKAKDKKSLDKFLKAVRGEKSPLTFSSILPRPKEYDFITGGITIDGKQYDAWREINGKNIPVTEKEKAKLVKKYGAPDWYRWSLTNWGTKWDIDDAGMERISDKKVLFSFDTAWSPPTAWCQYAAEKFPGIQLDLKYEEDGMDIHGREIFEEEVA